MLNIDGCSHFARHYFGNLGWFLFLWVLRCFSSPGSLHMTYGFSQGYSLLSGFPHSDISGSMLICQLPRAFRRLPRPSSPIIAKASTRCTYSLDPITSNTYQHFRTHTRFRLSKSVFATFRHNNSFRNCHSGTRYNLPKFFTTNLRLLLLFC